jgi:hypothetical protein
MAKMANKKSQIIYVCNLCDYNTSNKSDYYKHLSTRKHQIHENANKFVAKVAKVAKNKFVCDCGKEYIHQSSLCKHKKKCKGIITTIDTKLEPDVHELIMKLITDNQDMKKENQELINKLIDQQQQMTDLIPKIGNNMTINNKQKFNINVFLNEKCKDAISIQEFIENIEISMKNLLTTKENGLGEGLSNIIIDNMNKLSLYERPIHCTDKKRETLYIKNNEWEKDDNKEQVNDLIRKVENKQMKNIKQWTDEHPNYMENDKLQEEYINLVRSCTTSIDASKDKVIKKVCDNVYLTEK